MGIKGTVNFYELAGKKGEKIVTRASRQHLREKFHRPMVRSRFVLWYILHRAFEVVMSREDGCFDANLLASRTDLIWRPWMVGYIQVRDGDEDFVGDLFCRWFCKLENCRCGSMLS